MQNKKFSQQLLEAVLNANRKIFICGFLRTVTGALLYTSVLPTSVQMLSVLESASDLTHVHHTQVQQWTRTSSNYVVLMWTCLRSSKIFTRSRLHQFYCEFVWIPCGKRLFTLFGHWRITTVFLWSRQSLFKSELCWMIWTFCYLFFLWIHHVEERFVVWLTVVWSLWLIPRLEIYKVQNCWSALVNISIT